jgi:hypothetical protein
MGLPFLETSENGWSAFSPALAAVHELRLLCICQIT